MNDYITIALTKGRLANKTMELLEKAGYCCEELKEKGSRKLIFVNEASESAGCAYADPERRKNCSGTTR